MGCVKALVCFLLLLNVYSALGGSTSSPNTAVAAKPDLFGLNFNFWINGVVYQNIEFPAGTNVPTNHPYNNTVLLNFFKNIKSTANRYPGGTIGSFWNVTSNYFVETTSSVCTQMATNSTYKRKCADYTQANTTNKANYPNQNSLSLRAYGENMKAAGLQWIYVANLFTSSTDEIIAAIENACADGGACPTFLELGNEYYLTANGWFPSGLIPNVESYIAKCVTIYKAVSKYFPGNIIGQSAYDGYTSTNPLNTQFAWNKGVENATSHRPLVPGYIGFDHLSSHTYSLKVQNLPVSRPEIWNTMMLAWPETNIRRVADVHLQRNAPGTELWMTEFNLGAAEALGTGPAAALQFMSDQIFQTSHGLNIAAWYLSMMKYPNVFTKAWLFDSLRDQNMTTFNISRNGYQVYAPGQIFSHLSTIMQSHTTYNYLDFADVPTINSTGVTWFGSWTGTLSALQGVLFESATQKTYVIINRIGQAVDVDLTEAAGLGFVTTWEYVINDQRIPTTFNFDINIPPPYAGPIPVTITPTTAATAKPSVTLKPYSMQVLTFSATTTTATATTATGQATTATGESTTATGQATTTTSDAATTSAAATTAAATTSAAATVTGQATTGDQSTSTIVVSVKAAITIEDISTFNKTVFRNNVASTLAVPVLAVSEPVITTKAKRATSYDLSFTVTKIISSSENAASVSQSVTSSIQSAVTNTTSPLGGFLRNSGASVSDVSGTYVVTPNGNDSGAVSLSSSLAFVFAALAIAFVSL